MIALTAPLGQAANAESSTDGWRLIGLIGITLATIAILALIFRPRNGAEPSPDGGEPAPIDDFETPGLLRFPGTPATPQTDAELAAERLRQIVSRGAPDERHRPAGAPPARRGEPADESASEDTAMETGEESRIPGMGEAGIDAEALEEQLRRLFGPHGEPGKIVPFTPRKPQPPGTPEGQPAGFEEPRRTRAESRITRFPVDTATRDGITATIQELLFCANVGELLHGFALYTDRYLFQFMDESGMNENEFRAAYSDIPAKDPADWTRIDSITDFARLDDGRVTVRVRYIDGSAIDGTEQFTMRYDAHLNRWLIDNIQAS
jgi:hypothetical protein